jgi:hypothetical protein
LAAAADRGGGGGAVAADGPRRDAGGAGSLAAGRAAAARGGRGGEGVFIFPRREEKLPQGCAGQARRGHSGLAQTSADMWCFESRFPPQVGCHTAPHVSPFSLPPPTWPPTPRAPAVADRRFGRSRPRRPRGSSSKRGTPSSSSSSRSRPAAPPPAWRPWWSPPPRTASPPRSTRSTRTAGAA